MLKKIACSILAVILITTQAFALSGKMTGGFPDKSTFQHTADDYQAQQRAGYGYLPQGLTFYKDFTKIPAGTYSNAVMGNLLNADYSIGSPVATFTSTSGSFTIGANGYNATTANDEVLKYLITGNRTAAQETIIIKFTPTGDFANDGNYRTLLDNDGDRRLIRKQNTGTVLTIFANGGGGKEWTTNNLGGIPYTIGTITQATGNPNIRVYLSGIQEGTDENTDFTTNVWTTYFYVGSNNSGAGQIIGNIQKIAFFSRILSANEVTTATNLM